MYYEGSLLVTWEAFEKELHARFGPIDYEDFEEALSPIWQNGTLRGYQKEFERLAAESFDWNIYWGSEG